MTEIQYTMQGDYHVPNLTIPLHPSQPLNKYERMRAKHPEEQRPILYQTILLNGTLTSHLQEISETASRRLEQMMPRMAKLANVAGRGNPAGGADLQLSFPDCNFVSADIGCLPHLTFMDNTSSPVSIMHRNVGIIAGSTHLECS